jgi:thiamine phosphate synthase YjbQ (UPF0047 family)
VLRLSTPGDGAIVDLTEGVRSIVRRSEVADGVAVVFAVGATVAVTTMEHEPGGIADLQALLDRLVPVEGAYETTPATTTRTRTRTCGRRSSGRRSRCPSSAASSGSAPGSRSC